MSALSIQPTYPIFTDIDGQPLENGYVWIGTANLDPQTNPINVYWDVALTIPATQPIRTLAGYPSRSGTPARLYVNSDYSIRVQNRNGSMVYSAPTATERYSDVVLEPFIGFKGQVGTVQDLADNDGSDWIGFVQSGSGVVARSAQDKLREFWDVEDFAGATDQLKVQAAFDSGKPIKFSKNYSVDSVTISSVGQSIDFNGYSLIGTRPTGGIGAAYVLGIAGRQLRLYDVAVNADFKNYAAAIRWFSVSNAAPAQFNNVYGMSVAYCINGLTFGQEIGTPSVDAAQSENAIYGFKCRGAQKAFVGNQSNGFITLVSPQIDCNPYEWSLQPGYNATTWQTAARAIHNVVGKVVILGGEVLKTSTQLGYGVEGRGIDMIGTTVEIACANFLVQGDLRLKDISNFYMSSDSAAAFTLDAGAGAGDSVMVTLDSCTPQRGNDVWSYSGTGMIIGSSTIPVTFNFVNCQIRNWGIYRIASDNASVVGAGNVTNAIVRFVNTRSTNVNGAGATVLDVILQNTSSATTSAVASAATIGIETKGQIFHVSGTAAINIIEPPLTSFRGTVTIIPDGAFTLTTAGNIGKASTAVVGQAMTLHYDGVKWYPSY